MTRPSSAAWSLAVLACAVIVTACGSSEGTGRTRKADVASRQSQALAYSQCMRSRGVANFPDPSTSGGDVGVSLKSISGVNPASRSFQAAQKACGKLLPGNGPGSVKPSVPTEKQMLAISDCMRAHGVNGFPDPTTTTPSSPAGYSGVLTRNGVSFAIPTSVDIESPAVQQAAGACHLGGLGRGGIGGGSL